MRFEVQGPGGGFPASSASSAPDSPSLRLQGFGSALDAVYIYVVTWSEFPLSPPTPTTHKTLISGVEGSGREDMWVERVLLGKNSFSLKLSGNNVYCTNALLLLITITLCVKLHCQNDLN